MSLADAAGCEVEERQGLAWHTLAWHTLDLQHAFGAWDSGLSSIDRGGDS